MNVYKKIIKSLTSPRQRVQIIKWKRHLNLSEWRLGGYSREGEYSLVNLLQKGKQTLEDLITPIDPEYRCIAIRAGGYNIQPSEEIGHQ